ncbi:MAG: hypothetical protein NT027_15645 [Proteobacteria bacterium]|nr:hypothetical protein [Pseudomonadota bacterium]
MMYGEPTNPIPFVVASYALGAIGIFGYALWVYFHRKKLTEYLSVLKSNRR